MANYADVAMEAIREQVGDRNVFLLVSGGVDSSVAFVLFNQALGADRVLGLHIDNGFMRKAETATVEAFLNKEGFHNLKVEDASEDFLHSVEGMVEPEIKREAIGKPFGCERQSFGRVWIWTQIIGFWGKVLYIPTPLNQVARNMQH